MTKCQLPTTEGAGLSIPLTVFTVSEVQSPKLLRWSDIIGWLTSKALPLKLLGGVE